MRGLIVFDCDGTLVDSQHTIVESMVAAFHANDWPAPDAARVRGVVGLSLDEAIAILAPQCPTERRVAIRTAYKSAFAKAHSRGDHEEVTYPGVVEVLDTLSAEEYTLGIATGKSTNGLRATLTRLHLLDRFATLQTADTAPSKPHPTMLRQAMAETCATPETTALIGDTTFDMNMARNAGTSAIGVTWGYHGVDALRRAGAHALAESAADLPPAVRALVPPFGNDDH
jgi:phosphoglycolate phosphatase